MRSAQQIGKLRPRSAASSSDQSQLANAIAMELGEPDHTSGSTRDVKRLGAGGGDGKLGDDAAQRDAPDLVGVELGELQGAISSVGDLNIITVGRGNRKLRDQAGGGDAPDVVGAPLTEPEVAIRALRDAERKWEG